MKQYAVYRQVKQIDEYFKTWDLENVKQLSESLKLEIYAKYAVKCKVFQRDGFACQNSTCKSPQSELTMHHIKWKKNNGEDKVRNGVTLCRTCHAGFHKAKYPLIFADAEHLPSHIAGHTFKLELPEPQMDWKKLKFEMKTLRKELKMSGFKPYITWEQVGQLFAWLFGYTEDGEFDD